MPELDVRRLPRVINAALDLLDEEDPDLAGLWRDQFAREPGLDLRRDDEAIRVIHRGVEFLIVDDDALVEGANGSAWLMVGGERREIGIADIPRDEF